MNIICIGYYDKFSRFFLDIKKHLKTKCNSPMKFRIYNIHLSGFLYTLFRLKFSSWTPMKAWLLVHFKKNFYTKIINENEDYKGISFKDYIIFHNALNGNIETKSLYLQALAYIDIFDVIFSKTQPDCLMTIGDSRMCVEISVALAKQRNIKTYYIEQGPFSSTFFDNKGVNANLSVRNEKSFNSNYRDKTDTSIRLKFKSTQTHRSPIYRGFDILLMKLFEHTKAYPPDLKHSDLNSYRPRKSTIKIKHLSSDKRIVLLVLQVPLDVNMIYHSPNFKSHTEILESVYLNLPKDTQLIVREHPLYINKYEKSLYQFIARHNITVENTTNLNTAIDDAETVIVNNSTVGIEAILSYKPVVVLGNAFYDNDTICLKLKSKDDLKQVLQNSLDYKPNKEQIDNFKRLLFNSVLIKGAITDKDLQSSKHIANYLLANH